MLAFGGGISGNIITGTKRLAHFRNCYACGHERWNACWHASIGTHASHLIASGLDVLAISRRLGHGSPTITLGVYGHLFANADDRAADAIEATFAAARRDP